MLEAKKLTVNQQNFCLHYAWAEWEMWTFSSKNASEDYLNAYSREIAIEAYQEAYSCKNLTDDSIRLRASELLKMPKITFRVRELIAHHEKRYLSYLEEIRPMVTNVLADSTL